MSGSMFIGGMYFLANVCIIRSIALQARGTRVAPGINVLDILLVIGRNKVISIVELNAV